MRCAEKHFSRNAQKTRRNSLLCYCLVIGILISLGRAGHASVAILPRDSIHTTPQFGNQLNEISVLSQSNNSLTFDIDCWHTGHCQICDENSDYDCSAYGSYPGYDEFNYGISTPWEACPFADPVPENNMVTRIEVTVYGVACPEYGGSMTSVVSLNGQEIGEGTQDGDCSCGTCYPLTLSSADYPDGFPEYVYGGENRLSIVIDGVSCISDVHVRLDYGESCEVDDDAPTASSGVEFNGSCGLPTFLPVFNPCIEKRQFTGGPAADCLLNDGEDLTDDCGNKFQLWCARDLDNCGLCYGFFYLPGNGDAPKEVGRCSFTGGLNSATVWYVPDADGNEKPEAFVKSEWTNVEPGTSRDCLNQESETDNERNWWSYIFDVRNNVTYAQCYEGGTPVDIPNMSPSTRDLPPVLPADVTGDSPMEVGPSRAPCDLNFDYACDGTDFELMFQSMETCWGDNGYSILADLDLSGCVDSLDQIRLFPKTLVYVDVRPRSCPNPINPKAQGVLPIAILGSPAYDITHIDATSLRLEGVAPLRTELEDVGTPVREKDDPCTCDTMGSDGYVDLIAKFDAIQIAMALGPLQSKEVRTLTVTGNFFDGSPIEGSDCVIVSSAGGQGKVKGQEAIGPAFVLGRNYPNPFNSSTVISYDVNQASRVRIEVVNVLGQLVSMLLDERREPGTYSIVWNGTDSHGNAVPSGTYFCRLTAGDFVQTQKMVLIR